MKEENVGAVVYFSFAVRPLTDQDFVTLLCQSRTYNAQHAITGLLLYQDGTFAHYLEGPQNAVGEVLAKIEQDPRHKSMAVMLKERRTARLFPQWALGFKNVGCLLSAQEAEMSPWLGPSIIADVFGGSEQTALKLFALFCTNTR